MLFAVLDIVSFIIFKAVLLDDLFMFSVEFILVSLVFDLKTFTNLFK